MSTILNSITVIGIIEVLIILSCLWLFYNRFIKGKSSAKFVRGIFVLIILWIFSLILLQLHLIILGLFLRYCVMFILVSLVVIFQPELRKFLGMLGTAKFFDFLISPKSVKQESELNNSIEEVLKAVVYMASKKTGALIVFQNDSLNIIETGVELNAKITSELLLTIFHNKTPLHDGAVIISENKILLAGAILPLTEKNKINWQYGTRHRAALGASETLGSSVLVVSEETGNISIASKGNLKQFDDMKKLKIQLRLILMGK